MCKHMVAAPNSTGPGVPGQFRQGRGFNSGATAHIFTEANALGNVCVDATGTECETRANALGITLMRYCDGEDKYSGSHSLGGGPLHLDTTSLTSLLTELSFILGVTRSCLCGKCGEGHGGSRF